MDLIVILVVGVVVGAGVAWALARRRTGHRAEPVDLVAELRRVAEEQRWAADEQRDAAVAAALQQLVTHNEAVLEQERVRGTQQLDGKSTLIDQQLVSMKAELAKVTELMRTLERDRERKFGELSAALSQQNEGMASLIQTTQSLREALSSPKSRGQWGERMAEDVLRLAGFVENVNYRKQRAVEQGRGIPDFTFLLPNDLVLHMDVKFPLDNYVRCIESESELDQKRYRDDFLRDVRGRVKDLASRSYIDPSGGTVDFVLLFIPNEQLYAFIHEQDGSILEEAARQRVVFCSPLTLFAVLALIRQTVENFQLARTSDEIVALLGQFSEQWQKFVDQMEKVGSRFESVSKEYEVLVGRRRRALEGPLSKIEALRQQEQLSLVDEEAAAERLILEA